MFGLGWLLKRLRPVAKPARLDLGGPYYIDAFMSQLSLVAVELSEGSNLVHTRFSREKECVEFYAADGLLLAEARVHGSEGSPYCAKVKLRLGDFAKELFRKAFPFKVDFEPLQA